MTDRTLWHATKLNEYESDADVAACANRERVDDPAKANLVSSLCENGQHMPVIDLDVPHHYEPSSTPGHGHLYIDKPMTWETFERLLDVLGEIGVVELGFVKLSKLRGAAFVRKPGVKKTVDEGAPF